MPTKGTSTEPRFRDFARALSSALATKGVTQTELANRLGTVQSAVSAWTAGTSEPDRETVAAIERVLGLTPGFLSRQLVPPYLPVTKGPTPVTVEDAVASDPLLDDAGKRAVLAVYRELVSFVPKRAGRPSRRT